MKKLMIIFLLLTTACVPTKIVDELMLIHATGFDYIDEKNMRATISVPVYHQGSGHSAGEQSVTSETITGVGHTAKDIRSEMDSKSPRLIENSKLAVVLFDHETANNGIIDTVDTFYRDPTVGQRVYLTVYEGQTRELLEQNLSLQPEISRYLTELIEQNIKNHELPKSNMHVFLYRYFQKGMDPFLPYLKKSDGQVQVDGLAIFKKDKMCTILSREDSFIFKMLVESFQEGTFEISLKDEEYATIMNLSTRAKYSLQKDSDSPKITINLFTKGYVNEYSGETLDQKKLDAINEILEEELTKKISTMIETFQELNVDPIGLGFQVKTRTRGWDEKEWTRQYPDVPVDVNVTTKITHGGVSE
ncbi:hypothetical protein CR194_03780 [Salipaludibacillus keqinensis]|uniref:Uncharacterized protein n=1 Tax=Salipaludibacillus keqinensis TaxID=2045207 RepID=A0A323TJD6_9BACI|nr:Ger(x)C family spore germination protein [Salipaludibacillus keqinensis]PYZ94660.1 hypothetical protein CR194_03780 [Salipaludibacillus keqinensis]